MSGTKRQSKEGNGIIRYPVPSIAQDSVVLSPDGKAVTASVSFSLEGEINGSLVPPGLITELAAQLAASVFNLGGVRKFWETVSYPRPVRPETEIILEVGNEERVSKAPVGWKLSVKGSVEGKVVMEGEIGIIGVEDLPFKEGSRE